MFIIFKERVRVKKIDDEQKEEFKQSFTTLPQDLATLQVTATSDMKIVTDKIKVLRDKLMGLDVASLLEDSACTGDELKAQIIETTKSVWATLGPEATKVIAAMRNALKAAKKKNNNADWSDRWRGSIV